MQVIPTVGVLIIKDDKALMVKHGDGASHLTGVYGLPAGRIEEGETAKQAAVRELAEETGLTTTESDLEELPLTIAPADIPRKDGTVKRFSITYFLCRKYSGTVSIEGTETQPEWVPIRDVTSLNLLPNVAYAVQEGASYL